MDKISFGKCSKLAVKRSFRPVISLAVILYLISGIPIGTVSAGPDTPPPHKNGTPGRHSSPPGNPVKGGRSVKFSIKITNFGPFGCVGVSSGGGITVKIYPQDQGLPITGLDAKNGQFTVTFFEDTTCTGKIQLSMVLSSPLPSNFECSVPNNIAPNATCVKK